MLVGLLAAPLTAEAQQPGRIYRIGFVTPASPEAIAPHLDAMRQGLRELGYVEPGRAWLIDVRAASGRARSDASSWSAELISLKPDVLVTASHARCAGSQGSEREPSPLS